jgi:hypothetical protein
MLNYMLQRRALQKPSFYYLVALSSFLLILFSFGIHIERVEAQDTNKIIVNTTNTSVINDHLCSLPEAIMSANTDTAVNGCLAGSGSDTIVLASNSIYLLTQVNKGIDGLPTITSMIKIEGNGSTIARDSSAPDFRILDIGESGDLTLTFVIITGGKAYNAGGIKNRGILKIDNSTITNNQSEHQGGGIENVRGLARINNSFVSNNSSSYGAGIYTWEGSTTLTNTQVLGNLATIRGGGVDNNIGTLLLINSVIGDSEGSTSDCNNNFDGTVILEGSSVIKDGSCNVNNDADNDGVDNDTDNCPTDSNSDQADSDSDHIGDVCDETPYPNNDSDSDGVDNDTDNCPTDSNSDQADNDYDGIGDACDSESSDKVTICHMRHNKNPKVMEVKLSKLDKHLGHGDTIGDVCDIIPISDDDGDGVDNDTDNCPSDANSNQKDSDNDGIGDKCDSTNSDRVTICHIKKGKNKKPKEMEIKLSKLDKHLGHGDTLGECPNS